MRLWVALTQGFGFLVHSGTSLPLGVSLAPVVAEQDPCKPVRMLVCLLGHQGGACTPGCFSCNEEVPGWRRWHLGLSGLCCRARLSWQSHCAPSTRP